MSQQSEFEYAGQANRQSQAINTDPREQVDRAEGRPYQSDYVGAQPMGGQKIYPAQRPRRRRRWLWALVVIVVILALLGGFGALGSTVFSTTTAFPQNTFQVSTEPHVVIKDPAGSVTIHTGSNNVVQVSGTEQTGLFSKPDAIGYTARQIGNTIEVDVNDSGISFVDGRVNVNITLPSLSDIQATVNAGSMNIDGVSGLMNIQANAGSIDFRDGTLKGGSSFQANAGSIRFDGSLDPNGGSYGFKANAGSIDITLPADSSFTLDATTNAGSVHNDFGSDTVGSNPAGNQLLVHTDAGSVSIHEK